MKERTRQRKQWNWRSSLGQTVGPISGEDYKLLSSTTTTPPHHIRMSFLRLVNPSLVNARGKSSNFSSRWVITFSHFNARERWGTTRGKDRERTQANHPDWIGLYRIESHASIANIDSAECIRLEMEDEIRSDQMRDRLRRWRTAKLRPRWECSSVSTLKFQSGINQ